MKSRLEETKDVIGGRNFKVSRARKNLTVRFEMVASRGYWITLERCCKPVDAKKIKKIVVYED